MKLVHLELATANLLGERLHRHHRPVPGHRFSLGAVKNGQLVGAAIVGRPTARMRDLEKECEVLRVATNGTKNACSFLLGGCARAAKALGYCRIQTFTLDEESGSSLRAAGWDMEEKTDYGSWDREGRRRDPLKHPTSPKKRWAKILRDEVQYERPAKKETGEFLQKDFEFLETGETHS